MTIEIIWSVTWHHWTAYDGEVGEESPPEKIIASALRVEDLVALVHANWPERKVIIRPKV